MGLDEGVYVLDLLLREPVLNGETLPVLVCVHIPYTTGAAEPVSLRNPGRPLLFSLGSLWMWRQPTKYVTQAELRSALDEINERINQMSTSEQSQIDTITAELTQVSTDVATVQTDLAASSTALQAEIDALQSANPELDLTALTAAAAPIDAAVQALDTAAKAVGGLVPTPPAPDAPTS